MIRRLMIVACAVAALACGLAGGVEARTFTAREVSAVVPTAVATQDVDTAGTPPVAPVRENGAVVAYLFSTFDLIGSLGYSGKPVDVLVGLAPSGLITGALLIGHEEPILIIGIPNERLEAYVSGFAGYDVSDAGTPVQSLPEAVSGATVSSGVIGDAIIRSARTVAQALRLGKGEGDAFRLDRTTFEDASWQTLLDDGSIARLTLHNAAVQLELERNVGSIAAIGQPDDLFIDLYAALATTPRIGQSLVGQRSFNRLLSKGGAGANLIFIAADGLYSFKGTGYVRSGVFDRVQIVQGSSTIRLTRANYSNIEKIEAQDAPNLRESGMFAIPADTGFDPLLPWRLELFVTRETAGGGALGAVFPLAYELPDRYRLGPPSRMVDPVRADAQELWRKTWDARQFEIAGLMAMLVVFSAMLIFQDALVRNDRVYRTTRISFLVVTLVWLGWIAGAQLSVVNILTFAQALLSGFEWSLFLLDPLVFILWGFVAVALLFWGRGVYCGWLCPFGALQELLNEVAKRLHVPQVKIPFAVHERLWPIKYVLFLGLFAVSLGSVSLAFKGAEVEPFKTAISLGFVRQWPFVAYAVGLLVMGLFIERFYCRYLCPLGAALAIPARLRMFDWLRRRHQCGLECKICAVQCTVQAIHPEGHINPNECIHCLNCQRYYFDKTNCPPLIVKEKRRKHREEVAAKAMQDSGATP